MSTPASARGVTWYALLGVDPDASADEIKAAWRDATDKFEPGSGTGQFRLFNEAADVLLDPTRRAAYDAELRDGDVAPPAPEPAADPVSLEKTDAEPAPSPVAEPEPAPREADEAPSVVTESRLRPVPLWLLGVVALVTIGLAVAGGIVFTKKHRAEVTVTAGQSATEAAQRALPAILSYDYRQLKTDQARADRYLTAKYRKEYDATFSKLIESNGTPGPAEQAKAVVRATVADNAVGVVQAEPDRVRVIAFVDQTTSKNNAAPTLSLNRLTVSMTRSGNRWLVDDIVSY